jgi:hypothetical protein
MVNCIQLVQPHLGANTSAMPFMVLSVYSGVSGRNASHLSA